jgi:hypothetical protein
MELVMKIKQGRQKYTHCCNGYERGVNGLVEDGNQESGRVQRRSYKTRPVCGEVGDSIHIILNCSETAVLTSNDKWMNCQK